MAAFGGCRGAVWWGFGGGSRGVEARQLMGERGPPPKPTVLKLIAGNPGKRELNFDEAIPAPMESNEPPPEVAADPRAASIWGRLVPDLAACGLARSVDWPVLTRYVLKLSRWIFLAEEIRRIASEKPSSKGTTYPIFDESGRVKYVAEFPWASEWRTLDRDLRADERALGISPSARSRISVPSDVKKTEDDLRRDFFRRGSFLSGGGSV
jgi:phage terminase small subunit